jgi:putative membrane protein
MTEVTAVPPSPRSSSTHFRIPTWVAVVVGGLLVLGVGFVIGRATDGRHRARAFDGAGRFGAHPGARLLGLLLFVLLIALVIAAIVALVRHFSSGSGSGAGAASGPSAAAGAEELLAARLAKGEIDEDEYRRRRDALRG